MTGKKIGRRKLFKLLPGSLLAAVVGVAGAVPANDTGTETVEVKPDIDYRQLAKAIWDTPLDDIDAPLFDVDTAEGGYLASDGFRPLVFNTVVAPSDNTLCQVIRMSVDCQQNS